MAKKDTKPTVYVVTVNGEPLRVFEQQDDAYAYIGRRVSVGGDVPAFMVVECEQVA